MPALLIPTLKYRHPPLTENILPAGGCFVRNSPFGKVYDAAEAAEHASLVLLFQKGGVRLRPALQGHSRLTESHAVYYNTLMEETRKQQEKYMKEALRQARKAAALEEVPIGCVIVCDGRIIARGYNRRNTDKNTLSHAELNAIRKASKVLGDWRLEGCTMYVTLEPCQMCAGALVQSRIDEVVIAARNPKAGCAGSVMNLLQVPEFNHQVRLTEGVLEEESREMLQSFFRSLREKKKAVREEVSGDRT